MSKGRIHDRRPSSQAYPSASELASALKGRRVSEGRYMAACPCHNDSTPSLSIIDGRNGRPVVFCFGGCSWKAVLDALAAKGLWPRFERQPAKRRPRR